MKLLLIHLSDVHVNSADSLVLARAGRIVDAAKNLDLSLTACIVAVTGDITYSGRRDQFENAWLLLNEVRDGLISSLQHVNKGQVVPVHIVMVPGNHDCDHSEPGAARPIIIRSILDSPGAANEKTMVDICVAPQTAFFEFLSQFDCPKVDPTTDSKVDKRLSYQYTIRVGDKAVKFVCCNTAWMSSLGNEQGRLYFPPEALPESNDGDDLVFVLMHHPYGWYDANNARALRDRIEGTADIVLTGHEHVSYRRTVTGPHGRRSGYVEGASLQPHQEEDAAGFNVLIVDIAGNKQKQGALVWDGERYKVDPNDDGISPESEWEQFDINRLRRASRFDIATDTQVWLSDPGITLTHGKAGQVELQDVFVFPELTEVEVTGDVLPTQVHGEDLLEQARKTAQILIVGDDVSGKTALAKTMFRELFSGGKVPVYLRGESLPRTPDQLFAHIEQVFQKQYRSPSKEIYRQLDRKDRVLLLDDFHKYPAGSEVRAKILDAACRHAGSVIVMANELRLSAEEVFEPGGSSDPFADFDRYSLSPLGFAARDRLVEKWLLLGDKQGGGGAALAHALAVRSKAINDLIGENYLPAYPVYVLAILQGQEAFTPVDVIHGTHGAFYEVLIKSSLAKGRTAVAYNVVSSYLAHVAYSLYKKGKGWLSVGEWEAIHDEYVGRHELELKFEDSKENLIEQRILMVEAGQVRFKYKYAYYYFVAAYLRDHMERPDVSEDIGRVIRTLHIEDEANILLFLAHLSKSSAVVEGLLAAAKSQFADLEEATLEREKAILESALSGSRPLVFEDPGEREARSQVLETMDETDHGAKSVDCASGEAAQALSQFNVFLKTSQILGQILKNFPGDLEGSVKETISESVMALGLRAMTFVLLACDGNRRGLVDGVYEMLRKRDPSLGETALRERAEEVAAKIYLGFAFGMIRRIGGDVGSRDVMPTLRRLMKGASSPARRLILSGIAMEHEEKFPEEAVIQEAKDLQGNPFASTILRVLTVYHFIIHRTPYKTRQRVCEKLAIEYRRVRERAGIRGFLS